MEKHIFTKKAIRGKKLTKDELDLLNDKIEEINKMTFEEHCKEANPFWKAL